jgi:hypothetical protein
MTVEYYEKFDWAAMKVVGVALRHEAVAELRSGGKTWFLLHFREEFDSEGVMDTLVSKTLVKIDEYRGDAGPLRSQAVAIDIPIKRRPVRQRPDEPEQF